MWPFLLLFLLATLTGCGSDTSPAAPASAAAPSPVTRVFVSNSEWIDTFTAEPAGTLVPGARLTPTRGIGTTIVAANGTRLYLPNLNGIEGYAIDAVTGGITPLPGSPFTSARGGLVADPLERFVWQRTPGLMNTFRVDSASGRLSGAGPPSPVTTFLSAVVVESRGRYAFGFESFELAVYRIDDGGGWAQIPGSPFVLREPARLNPTALRAGVGPSASLLFFGSQGDGVRPAALNVMSFDPGTGLPEPAFTLTNDEDRVPSDLVVAPSGGYLYVVYRTRRSTDPRPTIVVAYVVDVATGALAEVARADVTGAAPLFSSLQISPDGATLYVVLKPSPFETPRQPSDLALFRVQGGMVAQVVGSLYRLGIEPHTINVFETGRSR